MVNLASCVEGPRIQKIPMGTGAGGARRPTRVGRTRASVQAPRGRRKTSGEFRPLRPVRMTVLSGSWLAAYSLGWL